MGDVVAAAGAVCCGTYGQRRSRRQVRDEHGHRPRHQDLRDLFSDTGSLGVAMAGRAEELVGDPAVVTLAVAALAGDLLGTLEART